MGDPGSKCTEPGSCLCVKKTSPFCHGHEASPPARSLVDGDKGGFCILNQAPIAYLYTAALRDCYEDELK